MGQTLAVWTAEDPEPSSTSATSCFCGLRSSVTPGFVLLVLKHVLRSLNFNCSNIKIMHILKEDEGLRLDGPEALHHWGENVALRQSSGTL